MSVPFVEALKIDNSATSLCRRYLYGAGLEGRDGTDASGPLRRQIGERLCGLREEVGIGSQEALALRAGGHRTYVGRLERGETGVTVDMLAAILGALSVTLAEFFAPFDRVRRPKTPRPRSG